MKKIYMAWIWTCLVCSKSASYACKCKNTSAEDEFLIPCSKSVYPEYRRCKKYGVKSEWCKKWCKHLDNQMKEAEYKSQNPCKQGGCRVTVSRDARHVL